MWVAVAAHLWVFVSAMLSLITFLRFPVVDVRPWTTIPLVVLHYAWLFAVTLLCIPLWSGRRWAWSASVAVFCCRVAGGLAALLNMFDSLNRYPVRAGVVGTIAGQMLVSRIAGQVLTTCLSLCAGVLLFLAASWFGVEHRRAWRTTFREAWWAWMLCGVMGVALPLVFQLLRNLR